MSAAWVTVDNDDEVRVGRSMDGAKAGASEFVVRLGRDGVRIYMPHAQAAELHRVLGKALAGGPAGQGEAP
jgi:hypothetical protein